MTVPTDAFHVMDENQNTKILAKIEFFGNPYLYCRQATKII
jgi:hypothetical protein